MESIIVQTRQGTVSGKTQGRFAVFQGIPYGKAERFRQAAMYRWDGVLDCIGFGKKALQLPTPFLPEAEPKEHFGEDCLNLNIYTPDVTGSLPVLVDVHGGAFQTGSNQDRRPEAVAENRDFLYVSLNYRLGVFGYLYLGHVLGGEYQTSGNNGLTDQMLALRWIHENISAFGGDPSRVTVMGASAGAKSIAALMLLPESRACFSQVLLSSGGYQCVRDENTAKGVADRYLAFLGIDDPAKLLEMDSEALLQGQKALCDSGANTCLFGPVADGVVIPYDWETLLHSDRYWSGRAIVGSCRNELLFYKYLDPGFLEHAPVIAEGLFGLNGRIAKEDYEHLCQEAGSCDDETKKDLWVRVLSDYMYRTYSSRLAKLLLKNGSAVYQYSMEYAPALHCQDQSFAFESRDGGVVYQDDTTRDERIRFGTTIFRAYTNFVLTGDPNGEGVPCWPLYQEGDFMQMRWDTESRAVREPKGDTLQRFPEQVYRLA